MSTSPDHLTGTGIWSSELRYVESEEVGEAAAELEQLGFTAIWLPDIGGDLFDAVERNAAGTSSIVVATGILNIWMHEPGTAADRHRSLTEVHGDRFLFALGVSHGMLVDSVREPGAYTKPYTRMVEYLDGLDAAEDPLPAERRALAALGPKMVRLAADRTAGVHPYLVTPEHTASAREVVGPELLVAPEQAVVLTEDAVEARRLARAHLDTYRTLPNYVNNWLRLGFTEDDVAGQGSDRLVDALVAWGDDATIAARLGAHRDAGADHVCVQVLADPPPGGLPRAEWRRLADLVAG